MKGKFYIAILLVGILIFGCVTTTPIKMYQGEKLPTEIAKIKAISYEASVIPLFPFINVPSSIATWHHGSVDIWILAIDGKRVDYPRWPKVSTNQVEVLPGWHKVLVQFTREVELFFGRVNREVCFEFHAEAGHTYWIESDSKNLKIGKSLFITDLDTGKIIASVTFE